MIAYYRKAMQDQASKAMAVGVSNQDDFGMKNVKKVKPDPELLNAIGDRCHSYNNAKIGDQVERLFHKLEKQAVRHRANFRGTNYTLDREVKKFNKEREARQKEQQRETLQKKVALVTLPDEINDVKDYLITEEE